MFETQIAEKTTPYLKCEKCSNLLMTENDGFVIFGNIHTAAIKGPSGIIGNNFPTGDETKHFRLLDMKINVFCRLCLLNMLHYTKEDLEYYYKQRPNHLYQKDKTECDFSGRIRGIYSTKPNALDNDHQESIAKSMEMP